MSQIVKKYIIISGIALSGIILSLSLFLYYKQINMMNQLDDIRLLASKTNQKQPPARVISTASGNTWLDIQKQVRDTVVQVFSHVTEFNFLEPYKTPEQHEGTGTGFFINENGDIITNYHVVAQANSVEIQIPSCGLERFDVNILGVSPERDIALLELTKDSRMKISEKIGANPFLTLGDSDLILRSQEVLALGYPLGQSRLKSTLGIVSGRERLGSFGYIQITAPLNPGNSGGPALNTDGEVIGINARGIMEAQNVGYIIPINEVKSALQDLYKVSLLRKPTLGCLFTAATTEMVSYLHNPQPGGWYIAKVFKGTLLENVSVQDGDMLYEINGHAIDVYGDINVPWSEDKASLFEFLNRLTVGDTLNFVVYRKGVRKEFVFKFEHKYLPPVRVIYPEFESIACDYEILGGLVVMQLSLNHVSLLIGRAPDLVRFGKVELQYDPVVVISHVLPNSPAFKTRILRAGEVISEVNGEKIHSLREFREAILKSKQTRYITIRTDDNFYAVISLDKILREEDTLAARYFFKKSSLIQELSVNEK